MLVLLSPSKTLDMTPVSVPLPVSEPELLHDCQELLVHLQALSAGDLASLMHVSVKLAALNHERYQQFAFPFTPTNAKPAFFAFKGDVYEPLPLECYTAQDVAYANQHVRILSGLYGLLRPLDLMQPYRLEMGTPLRTGRGKDLYAFWGDRITQAINRSMRDQPHRLVVNLASQEYFKAVRPAQLEGRLIHVQFLDQKGNGAPKVVGLYAKQARGMMTDFIIQNRIESVEGIQTFCRHGYQFNAALSTDHTLSFTRIHH
jgi:cytoplasmic iron level regulating protein YaaA (DUF328/UPF0246 family)